jgi:hypothetical protein
MSLRPHRPVRVSDQHDRTSALTRFNAAVAVTITNAVGTMWCAYVFAGVALISLPDAIRGGVPDLIQWVALVLLSVIMVGQDVQAKASDARSEQTYQDTENILKAIAELEHKLDLALRRAGTRRQARFRFVAAPAVSTIRRAARMWLGETSAERVVLMIALREKQPRSRR